MSEKMSVIETGMTYAKSGESNVQVLGGLV